MIIEYKCVKIIFILEKVIDPISYTKESNPNESKISIVFKN